LVSSGTGTDESEEVAPQTIDSSDPQWSARLIGTSPEKEPERKGLRLVDVCAAETVTKVAIQPSVDGLESHLVVRRVWAKKTSGANMKLEDQLPALEEEPGSKP
jgi:hypothetical protein